MPTTQFNRANHELANYSTAVKEEEKMFNARNAAFIRDNPLLDSLAIVNPADENEYWKYTDWLTSLDKEDDIKVNIKILEFLSQQLRYRLRTKSKEATEMREAVKLLKPIFKQIEQHEQDSTSV